MEKVPVATEEIEIILMYYINFRAGVALDLDCSMRKFRFNMKCYTCL